MTHKKTIEEIVKKVDRKIERAREDEFYRIDFPPPGEPFDINSVLAYEISPDPSVVFSKKASEFIKILATSVVLFILFFFLFNASAYFQIAKTSLFEIANIAQENMTEKYSQPEEPNEQELIALSKDPTEQKQQFPELNLDITPPDNRLVIPKINKDIPIVEVNTSNLIENNWTKLDDDILEALKNGVVRYPGTAMPGEEGNTFITGHSSYYFWDDGNYKDVFALLPQLEVGDQVVIYYNQEKYTYQIKEKKEVAPSEVDVLSQTPGVSELTLMTCTPVGTNLKRLILVAELLD